jgi:hypothetical protein
VGLFSVRITEALSLGSLTDLQLAILGAKEKALPCLFEAAALSLDFQTTAVHPALGLAREAAVGPYLLSHTHAHTLSHINTHAHTQTHTHTHTHTHLAREAGVSAHLLW